jgi:hypothetical protein
MVQRGKAILKKKASRLLLKELWINFAKNLSILMLFLLLRLIVQRWKRNL